jgi:hypothetical protein
MLRALCEVIGHRDGPEVWNEGRYFSTCRRCGADLIRQEHGVPYPVPRGFKVAWKAEGRHSLHWSKAISLARQQGQRPPLWQRGRKEP